MKFLLFVVFLPSSHWAAPIDKIVAIVNDRPITLSDVESFKRRLKTGGLVDDALLKLTNSDALTKDPQALLNHLIDESLVDSEVKKKNMEVTIERVEQEIRKIAKGNGITRQQLVEALRAKGVPLSEYQDFIKTSLERQTLIEREVTSRIRISDEDISSHYLKESGGKGVGNLFEYTLSHIFFSAKKGGDKAALGRAQAVYKRIQSGELFEQLAEQQSEDPNFEKGGTLGTFKANEMSKALEAAVRKVTVGKVTPPVKTADGFHLVKVNKRVLISNPMIEEEKERIRNVLYADAFKQQFRLWLNQRRDDAFIKINGL